MIAPRAQTVSSHVTDRVGYDRRHTCTNPRQDASDTLYRQCQKYRPAIKLQTEKLSSTDCAKLKPHPLLVQKVQALYQVKMPAQHDTK